MRAIAERRPISNGMIEKLADPGRAVAEAWNDAINQDWQAVAKLDLRLSRATPKDICFTNALFLRVGWRNQSGISQNGVEAIDLLQKYVPYSEQTRFLLPWAYAGLLADEYAVVLGAVEKRIRIAQQMKRKLTPQARRDFVAKHEAILQKIEKPPEALKPRVTQAQERLKQLLQ